MPGRERESIRALGMGLAGALARWAAGGAEVHRSSSSAVTASSSDVAAGENFCDACGEPASGKNQVLCNKCRVAKKRKRDQDALDSARAHAKDMYDKCEDDASNGLGFASLLADDVDDDVDAIARLCKMKRWGRSKERTKVAHQEDLDRAFRYLKGEEDFEWGRAGGGGNPADHEHGGRSLVARSLPGDTTEEDLRKLFETCGDVVEVRVASPVGDVDALERTTGFVEMATEEGARRAREELHGIGIGDVVIEVLGAGRRGGGGAEEVRTGLEGCYWRAEPRQQQLAMAIERASRKVLASNPNAKSIANAFDWRLLLAIAHILEELLVEAMHG